MPVIVIVVVPRVAPAVALKVIVELIDPPTTVALAAAAVTPVGSPLATRFTSPVKPFNGFTVTVWLPLFPAVIVKLPAPLKLKSGGSAVVKFKVVLCDKTGLVLAPVTVIATVPVVAVALAFSVSTDVTLPLVTVTELGLKVAVTPVGKLPKVKATTPAKPPDAVTVIVIGVDPPRTTVALAALALTEKLEFTGFSIATTLPFTRMYSFVCASRGQLKNPPVRAIHKHSCFIRVSPSCAYCTLPQSFSYCSVGKPYSDFQALVNTNDCLCAKSAIS